MQYVYSAGRLTRCIDLLGNAWLYDYDAAGHLSSITDPESQTTRVGYDAVACSFVIAATIVAVGVYWYAIAHDIDPRDFVFCPPSWWPSPGLGPNDSPGLGGTGPGGSGPPPYPADGPNAAGGTPATPASPPAIPQLGGYGGDGPPPMGPIPGYAPDVPPGIDDPIFKGDGRKGSPATRQLNDRLGQEHNDAGRGKQVGGGTALPETYMPASGG